MMSGFFPSIAERIVLYRLSQYSLDPIAILMLGLSGRAYFAMSWYGSLSAESSLTRSLS